MPDNILNTAQYFELRDRVAIAALQSWIIALGMRHKEPTYDEADVAHEAVLRAEQTANEFMRAREKRNVG